MSNRNVSELIKKLFEISRQLEAVIPGRNFLPSGQQLGNLGEVLVAEAFGLNLCKAMTKGIDAHTVMDEWCRSKPLRAELLASISPSVVPALTPT